MTASWICIARPWCLDLRVISHLHSFFPFGSSKTCSSPYLDLDSYLISWEHFSSFRRRSLKETPRNSLSRHLSVSTVTLLRPIPISKSKMCEVIVVDKWDNGISQNLMFFWKSGVNVSQGPAIFQICFEQVVHCLKTEFLQPWGLVRHGHTRTHSKLFVGAIDQCSNYSVRKRRQ